MSYLTGNTNNANCIFFVYSQKIRFMLLCTPKNLSVKAVDNMTKETLLLYFEWSRRENSNYNYGYIVFLVVC